MMTLLSVIDASDRPLCGLEAIDLDGVPSGASVRQIVNPVEGEDQFVVFNPAHHVVPVPRGGTTDADLLYVSFDEDGQVSRAFLAGGGRRFRHGTLDLVATGTDTATFVRPSCRS
jgi:hypothetical protein